MILVVLKANLSDVQHAKGDHAAECHQNVNLCHRGLLGSDLCNFKHIPTLKELRVVRNDKSWSIRYRQKNAEADRSERAQRRPS